MELVNSYDSIFVLFIYFLIWCTLPENELDNCSVIYYNEVMLFKFSLLSSVIESIAVVNTEERGKKIRKKKTKKEFVFPVVQFSELQASCSFCNYNSAPYHCPWVKSRSHQLWLSDSYSVMPLSTFMFCNDRGVRILFNFYSLIFYLTTASEWQMSGSGLCGWH